MFYEATFSIKRLIGLLVSLIVAGAVLSGLAYGCAVIAGWEWLNPFRAFGIIEGIFVVTLLVRVARLAFTAELYS
jgi:hypothetical protein